MLSAEHGDVQGIVDMLTKHFARGSDDVDAQTIAKTSQDAPAINPTWLKTARKNSRNSLELALRVLRFRLLQLRGRQLQAVKQHMHGYVQLYLDNSGNPAGVLALNADRAVFGLSTKLANDLLKLLGNMPLLQEMGCMGPHHLPDGFAADVSAPCESGNFYNLVTQPDQYIVISFACLVSCFWVPGRIPRDTFGISLQTPRAA